MRVAVNRRPRSAVTTGVRTLLLAAAFAIGLDSLGAPPPPPSSDPQLTVLANRDGGKKRKDEEKEEDLAPSGAEPQALIS